MLSTLAHSSPLSLQPNRSPRPTLLAALSELSLAGSDTDAARLFLDRASSATASRHDRTALVRVAHGLAAIMASTRSVCATALETSFSNAADHGVAGSIGLPPAIAAPAVAAGDDQARVPSARRGSSRLPAHATTILQDWFHQNQTSPYATSEVLAHLVEQTGLSHSQVSGWLSNVRKRVWQRDQSTFVSAKHSSAPPPVVNASRRKFERKASVRRANARQFYDDDDTESEAGDVDDDDEEETFEYFSSAAIHAAAAMAEVLAGGHRTVSSNAADSLMMPPLCSFALAEEQEVEAAQRAASANADLQMWLSEHALTSGADASSCSSAWIASPLPSTSAASAVSFSFNATDEPMM
jgi:hypothetical protein